MSMGITGRAKVISIEDIYGNKVKIAEHCIESVAHYVDSPEYLTIYMASGQARHWTIERDKYGYLFDL